MPPCTPLRAQGHHLSYATGERFFASGLVLSGHTLMDALASEREHVVAALDRSVALGANSLRWNALLKGLELEWAPDGTLQGLRSGCAQTIRAIADMASERGLLLQIVLGTAHWLRFGYGGPEQELHGISNRQRVANIQRMMTTDAGVAAFLARVVDPIVAELGDHPALFSVLIFNEGYAAVNKDEKVCSRAARSARRSQCIQCTVHHSRRCTACAAGLLRRDGRDGRPA